MKKFFTKLLITILSLAVLSSFIVGCDKDETNYDGSYFYIEDGVQDNDFCFTISGDKYTFWELSGDIEIEDGEFEITATIDSETVVIYGKFDGDNLILTVDGESVTLVKGSISGSSTNSDSSSDSSGGSSSDSGDSGSTTEDVVLTQSEAISAFSTLTNATQFTTAFKCTKYEFVYGGSSKSGSRGSSSVSAIVDNNVVFADSNYYFDIDGYNYCFEEDGDDSWTNTADSEYDEINFETYLNKYISSMGLSGLAFSSFNDALKAIVSDASNLLSFDAETGALSLVSEQTFAFSYESEEVSITISSLIYTNYGSTHTLQCTMTETAVGSYSTSVSTLTSGTITFTNVGTQEVTVPDGIYNIIAFGDGKDILEEFAVKIDVNGSYDSEIDNNFWYDFESLSATGSVSVVDSNGNTVDANDFTTNIYDEYGDVIIYSNQNNTDVYVYKSSSKYYLNVDGTIYDNDTSYGYSLYENSTWVKNSMVDNFGASLIVPTNTVGALCLIASNCDALVAAGLLEYKDGVIQSVTGAVLEVASEWGSESYTITNFTLKQTETGYEFTIEIVDDYCYSTTNQTYSEYTTTMTCTVYDLNTTEKPTIPAE